MELTVDDGELLLVSVEVNDDVGAVELLVLGLVNELGLVPVEAFVLEVELVATVTALDGGVRELVVGLEDAPRGAVDDGLDVDVSW